MLRIWQNIGQIRFAKERYHSCLKVITKFCGQFASDFPLAFRWVRLKSFRYPVVEFFNKGVGFCWRAYRSLGTSYTCADSIIGPFVEPAGTTTPLTGFDERSITYLVATNAGWLPYLANKGVRFIHYSTDRVRRQFRLDQDIPNDFFAIMESLTSVRPFPQHSAFEFWSRHFAVVTIPGSQKEGICTIAMHWNWQAMMISFEQESLGSYGFSLIPLDGLHTVTSANPRLLLSTKFVVAYARKQSRSAIFEWDAKERRWFWYASDIPMGWEKRVKVMNLLVPTKKDSTP